MTYKSELPLVSCWWKPYYLRYYGVTKPRLGVGTALEAAVTDISIDDMTDTSRQFKKDSRQLSLSRWRSDGSRFRRGKGGRRILSCFGKAFRRQQMSDACCLADIRLPRPLIVRKKGPSPVIVHIRLRNGLCLRDNPMDSDSLSIVRAKCRLVEMMTVSVKCHFKSLNSKTIT